MESTRSGGDSKEGKGGKDSLDFLAIGDAQGFMRVYLYSGKSLAFLQVQERD